MKIPIKKSLRELLLSSVCVLVGAAALGTLGTFQTNPLVRWLCLGVVVVCWMCFGYVNPDSFSPWHKAHRPTDGPRSGQPIPPFPRSDDARGS
jgi:hypothetical protein